MIKDKLHMINKINLNIIHADLLKISQITESLKPKLFFKYFISYCFIISIIRSKSSVLWMFIICNFLQIICTTHNTGIQYELII